MKRNHSFLVIGLSCIAMLNASAATADDFYKGKTIRFLIGHGTGGGYNLYSRHLARHMGRNIPGKPTFVPQNMPGAGSMRMTNYLYNIAPKDGTAVGMPGNTMPLAQLLKYKGFKFDVSKFNWIGNPSVANGVTTVLNKPGATTIDDARKREIILGSTGGRSASTIIPRLMNAFLGTKFKIIQGFAGGGQLNLAMERGEVDGRGSVSIETWYATKGQWVKEKKIAHIVQIGHNIDKRISDVPLLHKLAANPADSEVLKLMSSSAVLGRPVAAPPGLPAARVKILRDAFDATMKDPAYLAEAKRQKMRITPLAGTELQKLVATMLKTPEPIMKKLKLAMKFGTTYKCVQFTKNPKACRKKKKKKKKK